MELYAVATKIEEKIKTLEMGREILKDHAKNKALAIANYDKVIAITIIKLKNGVEFDLDGNKVKNPLATITEKIAKGICYQERLDAELAEAEYKNGIVGMSAIQAELNGYQSIFRHLEEKG